MHRIAGFVWMVVIGLSAPALAAERLSDAQVTQLVQSIDRGFDAWKNEPERRNVDDAVIRSAAGAIDVQKFLDDMEGDIDLVKDRLKSNYAANSEVTSLLRRSSDVERRYAGQGNAPEAWKTSSGGLGSLAGAYGASWPLDANGSAIRKTDSELAGDAKRLADSVERLRSGSLKAESSSQAIATAFGLGRP